MVSIKPIQEDGSEKLLLLAKLTGATARIMRMIPRMDADSEQFYILTLIVDRLEDAARELEP